MATCDHASAAAHAVAETGTLLVVDPLADVLAELRGEGPDELAEATSANFFRLFSRAAAA